MNRIILLVLLLYISCKSYSQTTNHIDIFYSDDSEEFCEKLNPEFENFIEKEKQSKLKSELVIEVFPNDNNELQTEMIELVYSSLELNDLEVKRVVYFINKSHIYFDWENISDWNFVRLKYSKNDEIQTAQIQNSESEANLANIEVLEISAQQSIELKLKKGTILEIPADCFVNRNGDLVKGNVNIHTTEILSIEDALLSNVTTNIGDEFLESRGMIIIEALDQEGNPLEIAQGKSININIPTEDESTESSFSLYQGIEKNEVYDWILNETKLSPSKRSEWKIFVWKRIDKKEQEEIQSMRNEIISHWEDRGESRKDIRKRLNRFKKELNNRQRVNRKKKNAYARASKRNLEKISKRMILSNTKYKWHEDTSFNFNALEYYQFATYSLGMYNIDRIYKSKQPLEDIVAMTEKEMVVKLFFQEEFVIIGGENQVNKTTFKNIPTQKKVVCIATSKKENGDIELGYEYHKTGNGICNITNYQTYSVEEYKKKINELTSEK